MLIDIRDEYTFSYGHIDGAVNIPQKSIEDKMSALPKNKKLIAYKDELGTQLS